jgi:hypothetical protein
MSHDDQRRHINQLGHSWPAGQLGPERNYDPPPFLPCWWVPRHESHYTNVYHHAAVAAGGTWSVPIAPAACEQVPLAMPGGGGGGVPVRGIKNMFFWE